MEPMIRVSEAGDMSVEGIHSIPLNIPSEYRSSSLLVRIVGVIPSSIPSDVLLQEFMEDVKVRLFIGFESYDVEGNRLKILLDFVRFIGDTPAMKEGLDLRGETGVSCCHACGGKVAIDCFKENRMTSTQSRIADIEESCVLYFCRQYR